ncbi:MAG: hypothetical protein D8M52_02525 [Chlorobi bacterium]|nr:MAG: hypothetical protein F9K28_04220 [Bacteroidota bacterium]KXK35267.1 MAG: hypothetical protein UZ06_CHB003000596 [Chlorobi bacterium OLB6]MBL1160577.1 hypothetical protein [Chlorobiota bacterium]MBW7853175.1 hypothetical protein [Candidatus Kapabacteria bacterium]MCC6331336.1 hypothetical protein [Ignavibacteria bacterium]
MNQFFRIGVILIVLGWSVSLHSQEYVHGDPTPEEQLLLEMINRARANPTAEGIRLMDSADADVQQAYTYWQINKTQTKAAFAAYPSRPPLAFHPALIQSSRLHTADMVTNNFQGHVGSNGSQLNQRLAAQGYTSMGMYGENVSAYSKSVWYAHCGLNVDWGPENQVELGHRSNIMNFDDPVYIECGIGIQHTSGGIMQGTVGPLVVTQNFGIRKDRYITGVVYGDKNNNGFYDIGEGLSGVKIQPSRGSYWAVSSTSGGYAIPFSGNGSVTVTASGGGLSEPIALTVNFTGNNIKVDFVPASAAPGKVTLISPVHNSKNVAAQNISLTWQASPFITEFEIEVSTNPVFASDVIVQETISESSYALNGLRCGTDYYWHVRGSNSEGKGQWSDVFKFTTGGTPLLKPNIIGPKGNATFDNMGTIDCSWAKTSGTEFYHVRFSTSASFDGVFAQDSAVSGTSFALPTQALPPGTTRFYWQVRSGSAQCGWGDWSSNALVTPTITGVTELADMNGLMEVFPLPATNTSVVRFSPALGDISSVQLYSVAGDIIATTAVHSNTIDLQAMMAGKLSPGTYILVAHGSRQTASVIFQASN